LFFDLCSKNVHLDLAAFRGETMQRRRFLLMGSTVFGGVALGLAALAGNINLPEQNVVSRAPSAFEAHAATHQTRSGSPGALESPNASGVTTRIEAISSAPPTRSSFMATWDSVSGAKGYLVDVSTSSSFSSYVGGYHDLDVGNVRGRVVTALSQGTTYYYRVRAYDATGPSGYSDVMSVTTVPTVGLIIQATFDSSITGNPNAAANGGPYDGIVTLNSAQPFQFTRPTGPSNHDAQRAVEHEMDEVIGLGSFLNLSGSDLRPQDLFSWSSPGVRNLTSSGTRYFSINGGSTNIINFNQNSTRDFGDWLSEPCPQTHPYVQNSSGCAGQSSDIAATSPEGINLDVIGYDVVTATRAAVADFNGDGHPDYVLRNPSSRQTAIWYLNNNVLVSSAYGPTLPAGWSLVGQ
jgi:hypothetical protein